MTAEPGYWRPRQSAADELADVLVRTLLRGVAGETSWMDQARCQETWPDAFFPEKGENSREAKRICMACPVRAKCLEYALEHDEKHGLWGGLSERQRYAIKRRRRRGEQAA